MKKYIAIAVLMLGACLADWLRLRYSQQRSRYVRKALHRTREHVRREHRERFQARMADRPFGERS